MSNNPIEWANQAREFASEVQVEFKKVTWPTQNETIAGTVGVAVIIVIITIALGLVDYALSLAMTQILP